MGVGDSADREAMVAAHAPDSARSVPRLDRLTHFAAALCEAKVALVTLVGDDEQCFIGRSGTNLTGSPTQDSFCRFAFESRGVLQIPDAAADPRFVDNPFVTGEMRLRFYAGVPVTSAEGMPLGTLCVIDDRPRPDGLSPFQLEGLHVLAHSAEAEIRQWRERRERDKALAESEGLFRTLADTMPQMVWSTLPDGYHDYYNARWYEYTGVPFGSTDGDEWNGMFHPDDQARAMERWQRSLATGEPYEIEYRLRYRNGDYRWALGRALPILGGDGAIKRWIGTCTDIHDSKMDSEQRDLISRELSHRIKNIFAVVSGLVQMAGRETPAFRDHAHALIGKIAALGRAHDFIHPPMDDGSAGVAGTRLQALLSDLFAPYQAAGEDRIRVSGDDMVIDEGGTAPLALIFHELATNAVKYGALSNVTGHVDVRVTRTSEEVAITWIESGGPQVTAPDTAVEGFGSRLVEMAAERQLRAILSREWRPAGLHVSIALPIASLQRDDGQQRVEAGDRAA